MALCEGQLDSQLAHNMAERGKETGGRLKAGSEPKAAVERPHAIPEMYLTNAANAAPLNLTMDYRPAHGPSRHVAGNLLTPVKATKALAVQESPPKRKRGRPKVDRSDPTYQARQAELKALRLQKAAEGGIVKVKRQYRKRNSGDPNNGAEPRVKRKYTRRQPKLVPGGATEAAATQQGDDANSPKKRGRKKKIVLDEQGNPVQPSAEPTPKAKRGRKKKSDMLLINPEAIRTSKAAKFVQGDIAVSPASQPAQHKMDEHGSIVIDSDDEPHSDLGSPGTESLSLDDNLRALQHLHEKYANIHLERDAANHSKLTDGGQTDDGAWRGEGRNWTGKQIRTGHKLIDGSDQKKDRPSVDSISVSSKSSRSSRTSASGSSDSGSDSGSDSESGSSSSDESGSSDTASARSVNNGDTSPARRPSPPRPPPDDSGSGSDDDAPYANGNCEEDGAGSLSESSTESADKSFECDVCHKWFSTLVTMKIHRRVHALRPPGGAGAGGGGSRGRKRVPERYECDCCEATFSRRERLHNHKAEAHRNVMTVRCDVCGRRFEDERELAAHASRHTADERSGRCADCGRVLPTWDELKRHRLAAHPAITKSDRSRSDGSIPSRQSSASMAKHVCRLCGKCFGHAHSLTRHLANHSKAIYKCVVCKQTFNQSDELAMHLNSHLDRYRRLKT